MDERLLFLLPLISFLITLVLMPFIIRKLKTAGFTGIDVYKLEKPKIAEMGGIGIFAGVIVSLCIVSVFNSIFEIAMLVPLFVIFAFFGFGLFDDMFSISGKRFSFLRKILMVVLPYPLALPVILLSPSSVNVPLDGSFELGVLLIVVAPLYVVVCGNLVNIFSNFNGQSAGNVIICFIFILVKLLLLEHFESLPLLLLLMGAVLGFLVFNWYPAKVFPGNCGDYMMGAMVGVFIVINGLYAFGIILLAPMILHFLLAMYWVNFKRSKYEHKKFGDVRKDGTISAPHPYYLSWFFPYYFKLREEQITLITMILSAVCGIIAVMLA
ncbi:MAG: hypothetical protein ACP5JR_00125 [Thermoplasmata archaeon]